MVLPAALGPEGEERAAVADDAGGVQDVESGAQQLAADEFAGEAGGSDGDRLGVGADDDESVGGRVVVVGEAFGGLDRVDHAVLVPGDQGAGVRVVDFVVVVVADQGLDVGQAVVVDVGQEQGASVGDAAAGRGRGGHGGGVPPAAEVAQGPLGDVLGFADDRDGRLGSVDSGGAQHAIAP